MTFTVYKINAQNLAFLKLFTHCSLPDSSQIYSPYFFLFPSRTLTCFTTLVNCRHKFMFFKKSYVTFYRDIFSPTQDKKILKGKRLVICFLSMTRVFYIMVTSQCWQSPMFWFPGLIWISSGDIALFFEHRLRNNHWNSFSPQQQMATLERPLAVTAEPFPFSSLSFLPVFTFIQDFLLFPSGSYSLNHPAGKKKYHQSSSIFCPLNNSSVLFIMPFNVLSLR